MVEVPLKNGNGRIALIDDQDAERVLALTWRYYFNRSTKSAYVIAKRCLLLHRFILEAETGTNIDHRDGDRLNCQRSNLRAATQSQNLQNTRLRTKGTVTGFKGVSHIPNRKGTPNRYTAKIRWQGKRLQLGWFRTAEEAAYAYDARARELFGEFACLNFPQEGEQSVHRRTNTGGLI